jgi:hypothetical protein
MGWTRRAPPQPAASGGVLSSPGLFGVPRSAKYAGLPPLDHPARGHSPDEIRRLAARAASPRCRSSSGNSLCGQNSAGFRESARPFKGIICDDISEFESYHPSHAVGLYQPNMPALSRRSAPKPVGRLRPWRACDAPDDPVIIAAPVISPSVGRVVNLDPRSL